MKKDVIVIGAGASGLFCAIEAGKRGRSALVLEHNDRIGKKILVSGGGHCNFTNLYANPDHFFSENPSFCISALKRFKPSDFITLVERYRIPYREKKQGQLFCVERSNRITEMLERESNRSRVDILRNCHVGIVEKNDCFRVYTDRGTFESDSLVIATGGLSMPRLGANDFGYRVARQFGIRVTDLQSGLVPFLFSEMDLSKWKGLQGTSFEARVECGKKEYIDDVLLTHRGLSGPAILQISNYWQKNQPIVVNLFPRMDALHLLDRFRSGQSLLSNVLHSRFSRRFAKRWCENNVGDRPMKQYSSKDLQKIADTLQNWRIIPSDTEGYRIAEVTAGGVDTRALSPKTMEARQVSGLYFIGEVLDVTGELGGFNFQWAWSSGYAAGQNV